MKFFARLKNIQKHLGINTIANFNNDRETSLLQKNRSPQLETS
jgi:hypothetical protein